MPFSPPARQPRCGVVDLGSNSVRLVVYEGHRRNPSIIFNEKAVLRLGQGLQESGFLNEDGMRQALTVMHRYHAVARAMGAEPFEVLAPLLATRIGRACGRRAWAPRATVADPGRRTRGRWRPRACAAWAGPRTADPRGAPRPPANAVNSPVLRYPFPGVSPKESRLRTRMACQQG